MRLPSPLPLIAISAATSSVVLLNNLVLIPYLTRSSIRNTLEEFCQNNQTKEICENYDNPNFPNTSLMNTTGSIANLYTIISTTTRALFGLFMGVLFSLISKTFNDAEDKISEVAAERIFKSKSAMGLFCFFTTLSIAMSFNSSYITIPSLLIADTIKNICTPSLSFECNSSFSGLNSTDISSIKNLFGNLTTSQNSALETLNASYLTTILIAMTYGAIVTFYNDKPSTKGPGLFSCCSRNQEKKPILLDSRSDGNKSDYKSTFNI